MLSKEDIRVVVGIIGNVISVVLFLSPVPTFYKIWRKKAVEQYSPTPYLATFFNCMLWILYGLPVVQPDSTLVLTVNSTGFVIEIIYLSVFLVFSLPKDRLRIMVLVVVECAAVAVLAVLVLTVVHRPKRRATIVGSICIAANIIMYAAPLSIMKLVITTKSVEYMPFFLSLFSFLNGSCWTIYSIMHFDAFILVPNGMGVALGMTQLVIYACFYKSTQRIVAQRKALGVGAGEVGMSKIDAERNPNPNPNGDVNAV